MAADPDVVRFWGDIGWLIGALAGWLSFNKNKIVRKIARVVMGVILFGVFIIYLKTGSL